VSWSRRSVAADAAAVERRLTILGGRNGDTAGADAGVGDTSVAGEDGASGAGVKDSGAGRTPGHRIRLDPGRPGAAVLCLVALLSAALAAGVAWASRPSLEPVVAPPVVTAWSPTEASVSSAQLVVAVVGQVVTPGLVTLPAGSRVADAVAAAGGALPQADLSTINLARILVDGEQVAVGVPGAVPAPGAPASGSSAALNINTATESELEELPGVGPVLAGRIVQWRTDNGTFTSVDQLQEVDGIGPSTFEELRDQVTV